MDASRNAVTAILPGAAGAHTCGNCNGARCGRTTARSAGLGRQHPARRSRRCPGSGIVASAAPALPAAAPAAARLSPLAPAQPPACSPIALQPPAPSGSGRDPARPRGHPVACRRRARASLRTARQSAPVGRAARGQWKESGRRHGGRYRLRLGTCADQWRDPQREDGEGSPPHPCRDGRPGIGPAHRPATRARKRGCPFFQGKPSAARR
jgi:hypothetical protein